jgi:hypothetical protein
MRASGLELKTEGVVRIMHAEKGMGVEFTQTTTEHRAKLEKFLGILTENRDLLPELLVEPEGLETEFGQPAPIPTDGEPEDTLIGLFRNQPALSADLFLAELRKQRGMAASAGVPA